MTTQLRGLFPTIKRHLIELFKQFPITSRNNPPRRLLRRGRPVVPQFSPREKLYRRFQKKDLINGEIAPSALMFPSTGEQTGQSVNRSKFSRPEDVLWKDS